MNDLLKRAERKFSSNDLDSTIELCKEILSREPKSPEALYLLGRCYFRQGGFENAEKEFRSVVGVDESLHRAWYYLGLAVERQGRQEEAVRAYKIALTLKPDFKEALKKVGLESWEDEAKSGQAARQVRSSVSGPGIDELEQKLREAELAKGVYTQKKSKFIYYLEKVVTFVVGAGIFGGVSGAIAFSMSGEELFGVLVGVIVGSIMGIIGAGNISRRVE